MNTDLKTDRIVQGISGKFPESPYNLIESSTNNTFYDLIVTNRGFATVINESLAKASLNHYEHNAYADGMAIVLRAFNINSSFDLLPRFSKLQAEDMELAGTIIQNTIIPSSRLPRLTRLLKLPQMPEQQIALNELIGKASHYDFGQDQQVREGATIMYKILGHLWPKLYPPPAVL